MEARAASSIVLPRPGQVGIGAQGQYGSMFKSGGYGDLYDLGAGGGVRVRYRMRYERALGLAFESQSFDARDDSPDSSAAPRKLTALLTGVEIYQMFGTRTKATRYLNGGVGLAQFSAKNHQDETEFPGDGLFVSLGAGLEQFVWRSMALDFEMKYYAMFHEGDTSHAVRLSGGVIFYVSY